MEAIAGVVTKEFGLVYPGYPKYADMAVYEKNEKKNEKKIGPLTLWLDGHCLENMLAGKANNCIGILVAIA